MNQEQYYCRWSPTLGELEATHQEIWGTLPYEPTTDLQKPTIFFGVYGLPDFMALRNHRGKRYVLWAGSDIRHFLDGYWIDAHGHNRIPPEVLAPWLDKHCEHYVENQVERSALLAVGIRSQIVPSFLGDISTYPQSYQHSERPKLYTSVSGDDFELYGWDKLPALAMAYPGIEFHLYGNITLPPFAKDGHYNLIFHGRVTKQAMNEQIKDMQGALRLTEFDGFSEILAKSVLMGQWPVSLIEYPHILKLYQIRELPDLCAPNKAGREFYQRALNNFPWNKNKSHA